MDESAYNYASNQGNDGDLIVGWGDLTSLTSDKYIVEPQRESESLSSMGFSILRQERLERRPWREKNRSLGPIDVNLFNNMFHLMISSGYTY